MTATIPQGWKGHQLATGFTSSWCAGCKAAPAPDDDPQAWFAEHLKDNGGADYAVEFERFWRELVTDDQGHLDVDKVARELFDYSEIMEEASKVYEELAGFSKPNTAAHHVIDYAHRQFNMRQADMILHDLLPEFDTDEDRQKIIDYANDLHEGAYADYQEAQAAQARMSREGEDCLHRVGPVAGCVGTRCAR